MGTSSVHFTDATQRNVVELPVASGAGIIARIAEQENRADKLSQSLDIQRQRDLMGVNQRSPTSSDTAVGREIRELRRAQGRTQKELARMVGVTGAQLHRYETGTTRIAASRLIAIANALDIRPDVLIAAGSTREGVPPPAPTFQAGSGDDIVELIQAFGSISDPKHRSALVAVARMMAAQYSRDPQSRPTE
ncbi:helix-turn-helix domain-containing protein [Pararoseomonas indoligenes]|uniref:Helix-turn-helix transcriptional regulator n=1 Tax=Roseomonas indoligenes TaxID=2820811 RepID=A0A940N8P3_9PROT|nr:helix-turn-helix transcriptional regulator [Pararoseomonas indoligenes]MBP0496087.1 helix-turn-helix transcriptional regulator [Pararoseomonas indoligenes]